MFLRSIRTKIIAGYLVFIALILLLLGLNYHLVTSTVRHAEKMYHASEDIRLEMETKNAFSRQVVSLTDYFLDGEAEHREEFHNYRNTIMTQIGMLESSLKDKTELETVQHLKSQYELFVARFDDAAALYKAGSKEAAQRAEQAQVDPAEQKVEEILDSLVDRKQADIESSIQRIRSYKKFTWLLPSLSTTIRNTEKVYAESEGLQRSLEAESAFLKQVIALTDLFLLKNDEHIDKFNRYGELFRKQLLIERPLVEHDNETELLKLTEIRHKAFLAAFDRAATLYRNGNFSDALRLEQQQVDPAENALDEALQQFYPLKQQNMKQALDRVDIVDETALSITKNLGVYVLVTLTLGLIIGAINAIRITRPLKRLADTTKLIAAGDFSARLTVKGQDEIALLARSFNSMVDTLQHTTVSRDFVDSIIKSMGDSLVVTSADGNIVTVNAATCRMLGYSEEELLGQHLNVLFAEDDRKMLEAGEEHSRVVSNVEATYLSRYGQKISVAFSRAPLTGAAHKAKGFVCVAKDITAAKRMEAELKEMRDAAVESARLKSEFLANMSHEIRTPMNGVIGMTGLLLETEMNAEQREFAETIRFSGDALLTIINDILDFSKIEAGKLQFEELDFDLSSTLESTIELLAERSHTKKLELASLIQHDVVTALRGDAGRLRQVLTNLIGNAIKFTQHGEVVVQVEKEAESDHDIVVRFSVKDTGIGISEAAQHNLFHAFTQADGSTTRKYGGTGLGLAISKQLAELMGGQIGVISVAGEGSTFWFTARFKKQPAPKVTVKPHIGNLKGLRALIVDDNETNRKIVSHQLNAWGLTYDQADSGFSALELLAAASAEGRTYDLAILDLMMPEMDGFELARRIKSDPTTVALPLVLLTSFGQRGDGTIAREAGIAAYLTKPVRQSQLFECLTNVISQNQATGIPPSPKEVSLVTKHNLTKTKPVSNKLVLIAEDNVVNQKVAMRQLLKLGYRADAVANGREALEALERIPYDLVLMDCQMPEMDGYEATAQIRWREGSTKHTPIIAMTAHALEGDRAKCIAAGMDDYISKPVKPEDLGRVLERFFANAPFTTDSSNSLSSVSHPPVDITRLRLAVGDEPEEAREIVDIYLAGMTKNLANLKTAIAGGDAQAVELIGHNCAGTSANCGMTAVVASLYALEKMGRQNQLAGADVLAQEVVQDFERVKAFLEENFEPVAV